VTDYLTTKEVAQLLRIKERKVYDLAAKGDIPCVRATGKLLFPEGELRQWMTRQGAPGGARPLVLLGSHDPLLDWAIRESESGIATLTDGSLDGLARFSRGEGMMAGLHLYDPEVAQWNTPWAESQLVEQPAVLIHFAKRVRGLIVGPTHAGSIRSFTDVSGLRMAMRQPQSGAQRLFEVLCAQHGCRPMAANPTSVFRSETEAALAVLDGTADVAFGLQALAAKYSLDFVAIVQEEFDLLVDRKAWFDPPFQRFLTLCQSDVFVAHAKTFAGYQVDGLGHIRWNGQ